MISLYRNLLGTITQVREYQDSTILYIIKCVTAIQVRYRTILGVLHQNAGTNDWFASGIHHLSFNGSLTKSI